MNAAILAISLIAAPDPAVENLCELVADLDVRVRANAATDVKVLHAIALLSARIKALECRPVCDCPPVPPPPEQPKQHPTLKFYNLGCKTHTLTVNGKQYTVTPGSTLTLHPEPGIVRVTHYRRKYEWTTTAWKNGRKRVNMR